MGVSAFAENLAEDRTTHGDWVGKYGKDGYLIFNSSVSTFTEKLPDYVRELTYSDLYEADATPHSWWNGADGSALDDPAHFSDALWEDESMTSRRAPCIYNGEGVMITVDTGDVTSTVSFYSLDWDDNGRVMLVTMYDADGNEISSKEVGEFLNGVYLSAEVTGKVTFEFMFLESVNTSPSNAVVSAVFFDSAASEAEAEAETEADPEAESTTEPEIVETLAADVANAQAAETQATAPQTFDAISILASVSALCGFALASLRKRK